MQYEKKTMTQTQEYGQEKAFLHILTASIREIRQKTFISAIFFGPVVKHNRNELQHGKLAKTNENQVCPKGAPTPFSIQSTLEKKSNIPSHGFIHSFWSPLKMAFRN